MVWHSQVIALVLIISHGVKLKKTLKLSTLENEQFSSSWPWFEAEAKINLIITDLERGRFFMR